MKWRISELIKAVHCFFVSWQPFPKKGQKWQKSGKWLSIDYWMEAAVDEISLLCALLQSICFFLSFYRVLIMGNFLCPEYPYWSLLETHTAAQVNSQEFTEGNLEREH